MLASKPKTASVATGNSKRHSSSLNFHRKEVSPLLHERSHIAEMNEATFIERDQLTGMSTSILWPFDCAIWVVNFPVCRCLCHKVRCGKVPKTRDELSLRVSLARISAELWEIGRGLEGFRKFLLVCIDSTKANLISERTAFCWIDGITSTIMNEGTMSGNLKHHGNNDEASG